MANLATTKMSSKGQIVIPEEIRKQLHLKPGAQFIVVGEKDVVILKAISAPSMEEFEELLAQARNQASTARMKRSDIRRTVHKVRGRK